MKRNIFLAIALVFGMALIGCGNSVDSRLNGTWESEFGIRITCDNGNFDYSYKDYNSDTYISFMKGTYTTNDDKIFTGKPTHAVRSYGFEQDRKLLSKEEFEADLKANPGRDSELEILFSDWIIHYSIEDGVLFGSFFGKEGIRPYAEKLTKQ